MTCSRRHISPASQDWRNEINASEGCSGGVHPIVRHQAKYYERELKLSQQGDIEVKSIKRKTKTSTDLLVLKNYGVLLFLSKH